VCQSKPWLVRAGDGGRGGVSPRHCRRRPRGAAPRGAPAACHPRSAPQLATHFCLQRLMRQPAPKPRFDLDRGACWPLKRRPGCRAQATRVVDERGEWLAAWHARHARRGSAHLRSPVTQCVHAAPGALAAYCARHGREQVWPALARAVVRSGLSRARRCVGPQQS